MITRCRECDIADIEFTHVWKDDASYILCPECGARDSKEEIEEDLWAEEMALAEADRSNDDIF